MNVASFALAVGLLTACATAQSPQVPTPPPQRQAGSETSAAAEAVRVPSFVQRTSLVRPLFPSGNWQAAATAAQQAPKTSSPHHIFLIIPAYNVEYLKNVPPLSSNEKLHEFLEDAYDPIGLSASAIEAAWLEHDSSGFCGYGPGLGGYGKCYGAALLDANVSGFVGDYLMPSLLHQDPRYFRLGEGSIGARAFYAVSHVFIMRKDSGGWTFASGAMTGTAVTGALSNLYYPKSDRGWGLSLSRMGIDLSGAAIFNLEAEFWPDVERLFGHHTSAHAGE
ncbi:MAG TPA: hypothetical protein VN515_04325 [Terriglobales bacterium]|nr:hypothetical protein [Terriglobales bacterium]